MDKANVIEGKSAKRWQNKGDWNRASDAGGMNCALHDVLVPEQYGSRSARNNVHLFSHAQSRPLHLPRSLYTQNELMSAYTTGFQTLISIQSQSQDVLLAANDIKSFIPATFTIKCPSITAPQIPITSNSDAAYHVLILLFPFQAHPPTIAS